VVEGPALDMKGFKRIEMDLSKVSLEASDEEFKAALLLGTFCNCVHPTGELQDPVVLAAAQQEIESCEV